MLSSGVGCLPTLRHSTAPRVRFAPSPTGLLHFGGLRTALINWIFAKQNRGTFILRIEDTDRERVVEGAVDGMVELLGWAGIVPDEGDSFGGECGPYTQSRRLAIYREYARMMIGDGRAYRCFCSPERIAALKRRGVSYDGFCRGLSEGRVGDCLGRGMTFTTRLRMDEPEVAFRDDLYGDISIRSEAGDHIILKSDGWPTYHFANVIDDHLMGVTHIFRGIEWLPSVPKHVTLYRALGWAVPRMTHLPLLLDEEGNKISKRSLAMDMSLRHYRDSNYFPESVLNLILSVGGGLAHDRVMTLSEIVHNFDFTKILKHSSRLSFDKLLHFNRMVLQSKMNDSIENTNLIITIRNLVVDKYRNVDSLSDHRICDIVNWACRDRICGINDLLTEQFEFLWIYSGSRALEACRTLTERDKSKQIIRELLFSLENAGEWSENIQQCLNEVVGKVDVEKAVVMKFIRFAISGLKVGPPVTEMLLVMGKPIVISRLKVLNDLLH